MESREAVISWSHPHWWNSKIRFTYCKFICLMSTYCVIAANGVFGDL